MPCTWLPVLNSRTPANFEHGPPTDLLPPPQYPAPIYQPPAPLYSPEQLIEALKSPISAYEDLQTVLRISHRMPQQALGRGRSLLQAPNFRHFLSSPTSELLLVDGHCQEKCEGKDSPLSVFAASLAAMMVQNPACMVLHYFAGHHCFNNPQDGAEGPVGLMRSLICQVLLYPDQPPAYLDWLEPDLVEAAEKGDVAALCHLFRRLVQRVVNVSEIVLILDNLCYFERRMNRWSEDLHAVFYDLATLHEHYLPREDVRLKILITSAGKSTEMVSLVDKDTQHVSLRAGNVHDYDKSATALVSVLQRAASPGNDGASYAEGYY